MLCFVYKYKPVRRNIPSWFLSVLPSFIWVACSRDPIKSTEEPVTVRLVPPPTTPSIGCLGACKLHRHHPVDSRLPPPALLRVRCRTWSRVMRNAALCTQVLMLPSLPERLQLSPSLLPTHSFVHCAHAAARYAEGGSCSLNHKVIFCRKLLFKDLLHQFCGS